MKWKIFVSAVSVLLPVLLLPLALSSNQQSQCAYVIIIIAVYWLLEPAPIAAIGMLPIVFFPILGIISSADVCKNYMKESYMTVIGGIMAASAVESCKFHERFALKVLLLVGTEIKWLLLGIMSTTAFLSLWMTNTAATALMVPIVNALVGEIGSNTTEADLEEGNSNIGSNHINGLEDTGKIRNTFKDKKDRSTIFRVTFLLGVCYAANIGGTGTLLGSASNIVLISMLEEFYPGSNEISFVSWMMYNLPAVFICVLIGWFYLWLVNIYYSKLNLRDYSKDEMYEIISKRYKRLGSLSSHEMSVLILFSLLIALWIFRDPKFIPGWYAALGFKLKVGNSVTAISILCLMFFLPSDFRDLNSPRILDWKTAQEKFQWSIIFLIGGGVSLAQGAQVSGLNDSIGLTVSALKALPTGLVVAITCLSTAAATEIFTNVTTIMLFLPVLSQMALSIRLNPLYLMLPATVTASYAFMLPVATVPNAIVFEEGNMKTMDMLKPGLVMNLLCCCVQLFNLHTLGVALFDLNKFPSWADDKIMANLGNITSNATQIPSNVLK